MESKYRYSSIFIVSVFQLPSSSFVSISLLIGSPVFSSMDTISLRFSVSDVTVLTCEIISQGFA